LLPLVDAAGAWAWDVAARTVGRAVRVVVAPADGVTVVAIVSGVPVPRTMTMIEGRVTGA
jgi:hypothetical protein